MMNDNCRKIENTVLVTLPGDRASEESEVAALVEKLRSIFPITDVERDGLLRRLHARLAIRMDTGTALVERDHLPWLNARKPSIEPFYWDRFSKYLFSLGWVPTVVTPLDTVTDEVLDLCGDPKRDGSWRRRGLVMGDVQSGKTATYTALCCKAADAGYRLIILLTGTLEGLRRQTQERLDAGFIGLDSSGFLSQQRKNRALGVGLIDQSRTGVVFTSRTSDFSIKLVNQLNLRLSSFHEPVLLVVKKHKRILQNLENWLRDYNAGADKRIAAPLLMIDDEADNASVNTGVLNQEPTAINERIRALLALFRQSTYVGFTATPFANIFIDPETETEMLGGDLFPRDYIYALEPPTNYIGPDSIFGENAAADVLRDIEDADAILPYGHKASLVVSELPESLLEAMRCFVLTNAVRDLRGEAGTHRSMLVNVSRFTDVQMQLERLADERLRAMQNDIRNYSRLSFPEAIRNPTIAVLHVTWEREFKDAGFPWEDVQIALRDAALPIVVRAVNQRTGLATLDYAANREGGLRVIAVGGLSLSRGLTLEGLSTSYFFRNSQMYDTLLQMGRWFGYRDSYGDLCRIWLTPEAQHWYSHITGATAELRVAIRRMRNQGFTPREFGLKVRAHPDSLIVTARNKMRLARTIERVISVSEEGLETPTLRNDPESIQVNAATVKDFLRAIERAGASRRRSPFGAGNTLWTGVPKTEVAQMLRRFRIHPRNVTFQGEDLATFLERTDEPRLQVWDVVLPNGEEPETELLPGLSYKPQKRKVTYTNERDILVAGKSARVRSRGVEREGVDPQVVKMAEDRYRAENEGKKNVPDNVYRAVRERPLLLIHCITAYSEGVKLPTVGDPHIALGLSFPRFNDSGLASRVTYRVNVVEWRNLFENETDDEQDQDDAEVA
jgi:hypothetical protein